NILKLFYYEGYTHEEISEELAIPLGTIKTRIRMSIIILRKFFN
ncbi:MAG: RNA polymerase subunit sigma-70, partial [Pedobacter sp.]